MNNRQPMFLFSGDLIADRRYEYAQDFLARGDLTAAEDLFAQSAEQAPHFAAAWFALGDVQERQGNVLGATGSFKRARQTDPEDRLGAGVRLARLGAAPLSGAMSEAYVRSVFDQYAPDFDRALVKGLDYRGPQLLFEATMKACEEMPREFHFDRAVDLGCGTGLAGELFWKRIDSLVGVDISPRMVAAAQAKGCYNHLRVGDMLTFLRGEHAAGFDLAIVADALVYLDDLAPLFAELGRVLGPNGLLAFSVETHPGTGVILGEKLRFAHAPGHVESALANAGFRAISLTTASTRREAGIAVPGLIVVAMRS